MKTCRTNSLKTQSAAFTLVEVVIGIALLAVVVTALYSGMTYGMARTQMTGEDMRATQVMLEKLEQLRLYRWDQVDYNYDPDDPEDPTQPFDPEDPHIADDEFAAFIIPASFTQTIVPGATGSNALQFYGTFTITNAPVTEAYSNFMRRVTVSVTWTNGGKARTRTMETLFAKYGMQNNVPR